MGPLSYSRYKAKIGQESFLTSLPKSLLISRFWRKAVDIMRRYPPKFVAGVNKVAVEGVMSAIPTNLVVVDPGFAVDPSIVNYRVVQKGNFALFATARLEPGKGILDLVKVMKYLADVDMKVKIMGRLKEKYSEKFYRLAERYGVRDRIEYLGFILGEDRYKVMSEAKVMIYPSHDDTNSLVILESLAVNTPVVAYDIPGIRYVYSDIPGVILVKEFDHERMAREVRKVIQSKESPINEGKVAEFISHHNSWAEVAEQEINLVLKSLR
ncbi:glycosyltransferase family 4 protein [Metallosphaera hakonensis]|nr:glycosyltransferase [Metallosphaera hakonensis]